MRANGNIRPRAIVEPGDAPHTAFLVCACGGRLSVEGVTIVLLSVAKVAT